MPIRNYLEHSPKIATSAYVSPESVVIGQVEICEEASIWSMAVARGDVHRIYIGARSNIQDNATLHVTHDSKYCLGGRPLIIGEGVTVGHQVTLHACTIEDYCLIGIGAIVLDGAILKPYTLLGAGSLVPPNKILESGYLWLGNPAKKVRALTDEDMEYLRYSAAHYVRLSQKHKQSQTTK